jgi:hypothetical protein
MVHEDAMMAINNVAAVSLVGLRVDHRIISYSALSSSHNLLHHVSVK